MDQTERIRIKEQFNSGEELEVIYRKPGEAANPEDLSLDGLGFYPELNQRSYVVADDILVEQDVPIKLRDGVTIYADIFRPLDTLNVPALISWCFYGKRPGDSPKNWQIFGVPPDTVSKDTKFEGPDPHYWVKKGYAIINVDTRGAGNSEGNVCIWGEQDGRDGYDVVEWLAEQFWCSGKISFMGNSGLAMAQWWIAAEQPPHLTCIAPWEGTSDLYREFICEGGIPAPGFNDFVMRDIRGPGYVEDYVQMIREYPLMNAYWESKIPQFAKIKIPTYVTAGWSHLHLRGSLNGFRKIRSTKKWLRIHRDFEWPDTYSWWNLEDLLRFYDRYLKGIHNGWEMTPRIRFDVLDAYDYDYQVNRPEKRFPLERTDYRKLYLDAGNSTLSWTPVSESNSVSYDAETGLTNFKLQFEEDTEITGYMKLRMWVEADGNDDMDLFITIRKLDAQGEWLPTSVLGEPHPGAWGKMRVSHRELDENLSTDFQPVMSHKREQKLSPKEIVPVDIEIYPHSKIWHKGEYIELQIAGRYIREGWFEPFFWETNNKGSHIIHAGGEHEAYLQIPVIPPKHQSGDYIYR